MNTQASNENPARDGMQALLTGSRERQGSRQATQHASLGVAIDLHF